MELEELKKYDGREGRPAYVAVSGTIYDVSDSPLWKDGNHVDAHHAGHDLTDELKKAPHIRTVVERFPVVGKVEAAAKPIKKKTGGIPLLSIIIMAFVMILLVVTFML